MAAQHLPRNHSRADGRPSSSE